MTEQLNLFDFEVEVLQPPVAAKYNLTPRQWALYRLIRENTMNGRKTSQSEICALIEGYKLLNTKAGHDRCPQIWIDINGEQGLNWHPSIEKAIITEDFEYWLGSKEEVEAYLDKLWNVGIYPRLKRYWDLVKKTKQDGQGKIFDGQGNAIDDDSGARRYIEAYLNHAPF